MTHAEAPVWIALNGVRCIVLSCSPHDLESLAVGHLLSEGWIDAIGDLQSVQVADGPGGSVGVLAQVEPSRVETMQMLQRHQTIHGCGLRHALDCDPFAGRNRRPAAASVDAVGLLRALFAEADEHAQEGGLHAVAVSDGAQLLDVAYDVARHCAVDRAIGAAARAGRELAALGLVSTARISGAMALKAARSGLSWIASRSIATSLAREIAAQFGVTLIERAGKVWS